MWNHIRLKQLRYVVSVDYFLQRTVFHTKSAGPLRRRDSDHDFSAVDCRNSHRGDLRMFIFLHNERLWERQKPYGVVLGWVLIQSALLAKCYGFNSCIRGSAMHVPVFWLRGKVICPMKTYVELNVSASVFFLHLVCLLYECFQKGKWHNISKISHHLSQTIYRCCYVS